MENQIPIPTDNIYKFFALFGLVLFIFSIGAVIHVTNSTNEQGFNAVIELAAIKDIAHPSLADTTRQQVLETRIKIIMSNRKFFQWANGFIAGAGVLLMFYGFREWREKIQPIQDEMARLQLEKLRQEISKLR